MGRKKFNAEDCIAALNTTRIYLGKCPFTEETLRLEFKKSKIPSNKLFWAEFLNSGIIKQIGINLYCFITPENPIHVDRLTDIYKKYQSISDKYHANYVAKKQANKVLNNSDIVSAIQLLKANGFVVIKKENLL